MGKITFAICEKSYLIRKGLASVIEKIPDTKINQQIENSEELIVLANNCEADYLIIKKDFIVDPKVKKILTTFSEITRFIILENDNDIKISDSPSWHKELLNASSTSGIISKSLSDELYQYMTFRHL